MLFLSTQLTRFLWQFCQRLRYSGEQHFAVYNRLLSLSQHKVGVYHNETLVQNLSWFSMEIRLTSKQAWEYQGGKRSRKDVHPMEATGPDDEMSFTSLTDIHCNWIFQSMLTLLPVFSSQCLWRLEGLEKRRRLQWNKNIKKGWKIKSKTKSAEKARKSYYNSKVLRRLENHTIIPLTGKSCRLPASHISLSEVVDSSRLPSLRF